MERPENELMRQKSDNLDALRKKGVEPFGRAYRDRKAIKELKDTYKEDLPAKAAGRIMARREHGKTMFMDIRDATGSMQLYLRKDELGDDKFDILKKLDIGDILGAEGALFKTRTGEETIKVSAFVVLGKSLRPLPEKWHGLKDMELRFRRRYVDLIVNDEARDKFAKRIELINHVRGTLIAKGFLEVETPIMQPIAGGAAGRPFKTHHNALDMDLYLRIAPEIYLKKLLVGGFEKVFEMNRSFRNEGISVRHNPEFTMLEVYEAYSDRDGMMALTEDLIRSAAKDILRTESITYCGKKIDLTEWKRVSFKDLMDKNFGIRPEDSGEQWLSKLKAKGIEIEADAPSKTQIINIVGEMIEPEAGGNPVFVVDLFKELSPLAKDRAGESGISDRFELYIGGMEIANAYSELNDPIEQRKRLTEQAASDPDAALDEDFLTALEYGMPPAGGLGIGMDRLAMLFTDSANIREVILFPHMRPE